MNWSIPWIVAYASNTPPVLAHAPMLITHFGSVICW
jgi:hypothetical protein